MNNRPPPAFVGSPPSPRSPSLCFPSPKQHKSTEKPGLCGRSSKRRSPVLAAIGALILVLAYTTFGSVLFVTLETYDSGKSEETAVAASKPYPRTDLINSEIRSRTVDRLWSITEDLNILYKENWTRLAAQEVQHFQDTLLRAVQSSKLQQPGLQPVIKAYRWDYASGFLYSLALITTVGYGGVSPRSQWGRIAALIYALFGIPLMLLYLSAMGEGLSSVMRCIFRRFRSPSTSASSSGTNSASSSTSGTVGKGLPSIDSEKRPHTFHNGNTFKSHNHHHSTTQSSPTVPISVCIMILICYISLGAVLFHKIQQWGVMESLYFCFASLSTIGFGDLSPQSHLAQYIASGYILVGMAVVAMCFSLIQSELIAWLRKFGVQDQLPSPINEDVALVTVAMTPKS